MTTHLEIEFDSRDLEVFRNRKVDTALTRALRLAGNQSSREMKRDSISHVVGRKLLRVDDVERGMPLDTPTRKAEIPDLVWTLWVSGKPVPLGKFPKFDTRRPGHRGSGVLVKVNVGKPAARIGNAFVRTMRSGHEGVFRRRDDRRLPIDELYTSRLSDTMADGQVIVQVQAGAAKKFRLAWERGLQRELGKLRKKGDL